MSVEDSRLLACPLFWSVIGERTGLEQIARNEKAARSLTSDGFLAMNKHGGKIRSNVRDCEQEKSSRTRK